MSDAVGDSGNDPVLVERTGPVLTITLNRPDRLNALDPQMLAGLGVACAAAADPQVRAVVLTGAGRGFCAGADLRAASSPDGAAGMGLREAFNPRVMALAALEKPVIAAINGPVAGAGLGLALAADLRIAAETATFVPAFGALGLVPDSGVSFFLSRLVGYAKAFDWLTAGTRLDAGAAMAFGLVGQVVAGERLGAVALARATALAELPGRAASLTKRALGQAFGHGLAEQLELEAQLQLQAIAAPDRAAARARRMSEMSAGRAGRPST